MENRQKITLDLSLKNNPFQFIRAKQGDKGTRFIECTLLNGSEIPVFESGVSAMYALKKPDGKQVYNTAELSGNVVTIELSDQCLTVAGIADCEVILSKDSDILTSVSFQVRVSKNVYDRNAIESNDDYGAMIEATGKALSAADSANAAADRAESASADIEVQAAYAKAQGDYAKTQGDYAKAQGDYAQDAGETTEAQGNAARSDGDYARAQGDYAKEEADRLAGLDVSVLEDDITSLKNNKADKTDLQAVKDQIDNLPTSSYAPNRLINSDFTIDQRDGSKSASGYLWDMWYKSGSTGTITRTANTKPNPISLYQINTNGYSGTFAQPIERFSDYVGKTVTLDFWAQGTGDLVVTCGYDTVTKELVPEWTRYTVVFKSVTASSSFSRNGFSFWIQSYTTMSFTEPQFVLGDTVGNYVPNDPSVELCRCRRYFVKWSGHLCQAMGYSATSASVYANIPPNMYRYPTISTSKITYYCPAESTTTNAPSQGTNSSVEWFELHSSSGITGQAANTVGRAYVDATFDAGIV